MSLMEVNEASDHHPGGGARGRQHHLRRRRRSEAGGPVKITVIATGFDRAGRPVDAAASSLQTPVDLQRLHACRSRAA
jgi:hypothetical protein